MSGRTRREWDRGDGDLVLAASRARGHNRARSRDRRDWSRELITEYIDPMPDPGAANQPPDLPA